MIQSVLEFSKHATPLILLCLSLVIILLLIVDKDKVSLLNLFKKQSLTQYKIEGSKTTLESISKQLEVIAGNHLHELPQMNENINKMMGSLNNIQIKQNSDSERISKIEGFLKINI